MKYVLYVFIDKTNIVQITILNIRDVLTLRVVNCFLSYVYSIRGISV